MADISQVKLPSGTVYDINDKRITSLGQVSVSLPVASWSSDTQTVTVSGVTSTSILVVTASPTSFEQYADFGVYASAQSTNSVTFSCVTTPTVALTANIMYINLS